MDEIINVNKNNFGKKFGMLWVMLVLLLIPIAFMFGIVDDRVSYKEEATKNIQSSWAGQQAIMAPQLFIKESNKKEQTELKLHDYKVNINVKTESRKKGIFSIPVYTADVNLKGNFKNIGTINNVPANLKLSVNDSRGFTIAPEIKLLGKTLSSSESTDYVDKLTTSNQYIPFEAQYQIRGIEKLSVAPAGVSNKISINGNWGNPSFEGDFLPVTKEVKAEAFNAEWSIPKIATSSIISPYASVSFLNPVDNYRMATRSVKYAFLFLSLSFMTYFIYEITSNKRKPIHYLQYLMMGVAMLVFYLLLVSISEFIAFKWAYLISAIMTIGLIGSYTHFVITKRENKLFSLLIVGILTLLYTFLYILLQLQDFSLIIGSFGLFLIIALVMYSTRNVEWFDSKE